MLGSKIGWCSVALGVGFAFACGPPSDASSPNENHQLPPDKTEVTMQGSPYEGANVAPPPPPPIPSATVAPPPTASTASGAPTTGTSGDDESTIGGKQAPEIEAAVAPVRHRIHACYKKAQAADPNVSGTVTFDATVGKGKVTAARFVKNEGLSEDFIGCLLTAVKTMTFKDSKQKSQIIPLSFGSGAPSSSSAGADAGAAAHK